MSKLLDAFYVKRLEVGIEEKGLISVNQFGFRNLKGTTHAVTRLVDVILESRAEGQTVSVVFVDLKKAFDSVDHRLLIERLRSLGIHQDIVDYFQSFLVGRRFVSSRLMRSADEELRGFQVHKVDCGVLQGSISGPVLFSLFIDSVLRGLLVIAFADDLALPVGR